MAAMENPRILAYAVDAAEFPELAARYGVRAVPQTVVDGKTQVVFVGRYPEERFVAELHRACEG